MEHGLHEPGTDYSKFVVTKEPLVVDPVKTDPPAPGAGDPPAPPAPPAPSATKADPPAPTNTDDPTKKEPTQPVKLEDSELLKILNERGIQMSSFDDFKTALTERDNFKAEVEKLAKKELEFPNERAKALYEFAIKHDGNELAAARNYLDLVSTDLKSADPKTLQFKAFTLKYPNLTIEDAKAIFEEQYQLDYGDANFEGRALLKFKHDTATEEARKAIEQTVKAYSEAKTEKPNVDEGPSKEFIEKMNQSIEGTLKNFKGANISLGEYKTKTGQVVPQGSLSVAMQPEEAAKLKAYMADPQQFFEDVLESVKGANGIDWDKYAQKVYQFMNPEKFYSEIHSQGVEQGLLLMINTLKNNKREGGQGNEPDPVKPKTWAQALDESRAQNV